MCRGKSAPVHAYCVPSRLAKDHNINQATSELSKQVSIKLQRIGGTIQQVISCLVQSITRTSLTAPCLLCPYLRQPTDTRSLSQQYRPQQCRHPSQGPLTTPHARCFDHPDSSSYRLAPPPSCWAPCASIWRKRKRHTRKSLQERQWASFALRVLFSSGRSCRLDLALASTRCCKHFSLRWTKICTAWYCKSVPYKLRCGDGVESAATAFCTA